MQCPRCQHENSTGTKFCGLYQRAGTRAQAHEHLTTATTMYRAMDMQFWLEQAVGETATQPS